MSEGYTVAVVGATGLVGEAMLHILAERRFPVRRLHALASARSVGRQLPFAGSPVTVQDLQTFDFRGVDLALFSAGGAVSEQHAPRAGASGCVVIDNTSCFRCEDDVPLVVPEVNAHALAGVYRRNIVANPNCSTIQLVVALKPIYDAAGVERVNVATYQAVSGAGRQCVEDLTRQTGQLLEGRESEIGADEPRLAFNVVPHIDVFEDNGYTREEMKMVWETRKILEAPEIRVNATAVRVPVFSGHSQAVHLETREPLGAGRARELLRQAPGVVLFDQARAGGYPTAAVQAAGSDAVYVGRIREDISHERGLDLWIVSDNVRKGAALNSVQIAEVLVKDYLQAGVRRVM